MRKYLVAAAMFVAGAANAQLVWGTSDVYDPATGLDWSYLTTFYPGFAVPDGKRAATASEVTTFFEDAGFTPGYYTFQFPGGAPSNAFANLFDVWASGILALSQGESAVKEFLTAPYSVALPDSFGTGYLARGYVTGSDNTYYYAGDVSGYVSGEGQVTGFPGLALVSSIPEPSTWVLMALGMVGLTQRRFKK